jgi:excisionase family DNA binding protein
VGQILTTKELAEYLKLTQVTIYKYVCEGKIPGFKVGSRWRFDKDQIDELLRREEEKNKN